MPNSEIAKILGISENTIRQHLRNHKDRLIKGVDYWKEDLGVPNAPTLMTVWSDEGAKKLASFCRSQQAGHFLEDMGLARMHVCCPESTTLDIIEASIKGFTRCRRRFTINGFIVDMYLDELKIAVECDERGHSDRNKWYENFRQEEIEERLGCKFIRFNPHEKNFNLGKYINTIFKEILLKRGLCV